MTNLFAPVTKKRSEHVQLLRQLRRYATATLVFSLALLRAAHGGAPIRPDPGALDQATPKLIERLRADPYDYFRFVNRSWIARVCNDFAKDLEGLPIVRLHGDAHVEQFAVAQAAWGLDDFDDSARGPAVIDIVRFLGSVDLVARQRSWQKARERVFDRFVEGYKRGLLKPEYLPPPPDIVSRLRAQTPASRTAFLAWSETKMQLLDDASMKAVVAAMAAFAQIMLPDHPELGPEYFRVVRAGSVQSGVGSGAIPKIMIRVRGPSDDPADDELFEAKKIGDLGDLTCLKTPSVQPTLRIIDGSKQLGRLKYKFLAAGPELIIPEVMARGGRLQDWWVRSLDPSYRQVSLPDIPSVGDLAAISYDAGVQLGAGRLYDRTILLSAYDRKRLLGATGRLERRYRQEASSLIDDLFRGWKELSGG